MRLLRKTSFLLLLGALLAWAQQVTTGDEMYLRIREVGEHIKCQCGCGSTVATCNMLHCHFREEIKPDIVAGLEAGLPVTTIVENLIATHGSELRTAPKAEGFGLVGWAMPFAALALGLLIAPFVVLHWIRKHRATEAAVPAVDEKTLAHYQKEIEKELAEVE